MCKDLPKKKLRWKQMLKILKKHRNSWIYRELTNKDNNCHKIPQI